MLSLCFQHDAFTHIPDVKMLDNDALIAKYRSGMSNQDIFKHYVEKRGVLSRSDPSIYKWIGRYFWGDKGEILVRKSLRKALGIELDSPTYAREERSFWDRLALRFLENRESREEILKDLGLPSTLQIYKLVRDRPFWMLIGKCFEIIFMDKDYQVVLSMIEKSLFTFFL